MQLSLNYIIYTVKNTTKEVYIRIYTDIRYKDIVQVAITEIKSTFVSAHYCNYYTTKTEWAARAECKCLNQYSYSHVR